MAVARPGAVLGPTLALLFAATAVIPGVAATVPTQPPGADSGARGVSVTGPTLPGTAGYEPADCPVDVPPEHAERVTCGVLTVAETRSPDGASTATIRLPLAIIASRSESPAPDPLVFPTGGGPGAGSMTALWYFLDWADWAAADRDIIVVEQRGDHASTPSLDCPELGIEHSIVDGAFLPGGAEGEARHLAGLEACRTRLAGDGVDLSAYTSAASAADLADLRAAVGYDEWNLYGTSYGARLALTVMRDQPEGLRAVVLDGVYPPNVNLYELTPAGFLGAVQHLLAQCAADEDCAARYPDLERDLLDVLDRVAVAPIDVVVKSPVDRTPVRTRIDDTDLAQGLFDALYGADLARVLPFLIDQVARGRDDLIAPLAQSSIDFQDRFAEGLGMSVWCAEEFPFTDHSRAEAMQETHPLLGHLELAPSECALWDVRALPVVENEPVVSDIPTLLLSGGYDPVTPPALAEAAAVGLSQAYSYTFPTMGHGSAWANWFDGCPASIAQRFLNTPTAEPDASCVAAMPPTDFLTTADIHPTSAVYRLDSDLLQDRDPVQVALVGGTLLALVAGLVHAMAYGIRSWRRRRRDRDSIVTPGPTGAVVAAVTTAALNLAFVGGLVLVLLRTEPLILGFGLPSAARPLLAVPFLALGAAAVLAGLLVRAWRRGTGSRIDRLALTVTAVAAAGFAAWLASRGLLII